MKKTTFILLMMKSILIFAQNDSIYINPLKISGYLELYYSYDFANPYSHNRPGFIYSFNRHNEVNLNLGFMKANYETSKIRGNIALMAGTYTNANLAAEPDVLKNVFEANVGVKLSKSKKIWIDAGIFPSHIGFESAIGKDCWNLTRSILAENSPYFESGVKISYTSNDDKWFISGLFLNGWQRIQRVDGNNTPAFGHQLTYKPSCKVTLNSSSFIGSDTPDDQKLMRYFHNFYSQFQIQDNFGITVGFDIGSQQTSKNNNESFTWYSPVVILRYTASDKVNIAARYEHYHDKNGVIISTSTENGFQTSGYSVNFDYLIADNALWRIEGRGLNSKYNIFFSDNDFTNSNFQLTTSLAISF